MNNASIPSRLYLLPHHRLVAWHVARELLVAVRAAGIRDATLREHALKSAKSACLNIAEAAGRASRADKARVFAIARGEVGELIGAVEIADVAGDAVAGSFERCAPIASRLIALLTGLVARR